MAMRWHNQWFVLSSSGSTSPSTALTEQDSPGRAKAGHERSCAAAAHGRAPLQPRQGKNRLRSVLLFATKSGLRCVPDGPGWLPSVSQLSRSAVRSQEAFSRSSSAPAHRAQTLPKQSCRAVMSLQPHALWEPAAPRVFSRRTAPPRFPAALGASDPQAGARGPATYLRPRRLRLGNWREQPARRSASRRGGRMGPVGTAAVRDPGGAALPRGFWAAVRVWLEKPQVANRRLSGAAVQAEGTVLLGEGGEISPCFAAVGAGGGGGAQEGRAAGATELGRLWREVRGQLPLPPPLAGWGGPGELRALLRTLLPRGRPGAAPARELAVQGERWGPGPGARRVRAAGLSPRRSARRWEKRRFLLPCLCEWRRTFVPIVCLGFIFSFRCCARKHWSFSS